GYIVVNGLVVGYGYARDVSFHDALVEIGAQTEPGSLRGHPAVVAEGAVRLANARAEMDLAGDGVQHEMTIVRGAVDEMLCLLPFLPAIDAAYLEDIRGAPGDDRPVLEGESLARDPFRHAEELVLHR